MHKPEIPFILWKCYDHWWWCQFTELFVTKSCFSCYTIHDKEGLSWYTSRRQTKPKKGVNRTLKSRKSTVFWNRFSLFIFYLPDVHLSFIPWCQWNWLQHNSSPPRGNMLSSIGTKQFSNKPDAKKRAGKHFEVKETQNYRTWPYVRNKGYFFLLYCTKWQKPVVQICHFINIFKLLHNTDESHFCIQSQQNNKMISLKS